jgi:TolB protein
LRTLIGFVLCGIVAHTFLIGAARYLGSVSGSSVLAFTQDVGIMLADARTAILYDPGLYGASDPAWSPDGTRLAVLSPHQETPTTDITILTYPGLRVERTLLVDAPLVELSWSPDGHTFAIVRGSGHMHRLDAASGEQRFIAYGQSPSWSPDAARVIYNNINPLRLNNQLWVFDGYTGENQSLTESVIRSWSPAWSPNGEWIAFASTRDDPQGDLYRMPMNCGAPDTCLDSSLRLTTTPGADLSPAWSPDGSWIVFASARNGGYQVFIIGADGGGERQITTAISRFSGEPAWKP